MPKNERLWPLAIKRWLSGTVGACVLAMVATGPAGNFFYDFFKYLWGLAPKFQNADGLRIHREGMVSYAAAVRAEDAGNRTDARKLYSDAIEKFRAADGRGITEATFFLGTVYCDRRPGLIDRKPTEGRNLLLRALDGGSEDAKHFRIDEACRL
jgi:TPR repeat protein